MQTLNYELDVKDDRVITITLPESIRPGKHQVVLILDETPSIRERKRNDFQKLLSKTSGLWRHGDGLAYQIAIRDK